MAPRTLRRPFVIIQTPTTAAPRIAPRDEEPTIPITAVAATPHPMARIHQVHRFPSPWIKATVSGRKMHIWIPNSPEFLKKPGAPVVPHSRNTKPDDAQERAPNCAILKL